MKISSTDEKIYFKTSRTFLFYIFTFYISYTCIECGKDVMSYFASSSSPPGCVLLLPNFNLCLIYCVLLKDTKLLYQSYFT